MAAATQTTLGTVVQGGDIAGSDNAHLPELTTTGVIPGSYNAPSFVVDAKGRILYLTENNSSALINNIADATTTSKGIVQVNDTGLDIAAGVLSINFIEVADNLRDATTSVKGFVSTGSNIDITAGTISVPTATASTLGVVSPGVNLSIDGAGVLDGVDATPSQKGVVSIGSNIEISNGEISILTSLGGSPASLGVVKSGNSSNINITSGDIDLGTNAGKLDTASTWTKPQVVQPNTVTFSTSLTFDLSTSNTQILTLTGNTTINAPTNYVVGGNYIFIFKQDGVGSRTAAFNSVFKFKGSSTLTTTPNAVDIIKCVCASATEYMCDITKNYT